MSLECVRALALGNQMKTLGTPFGIREEIRSLKKARMFSMIFQVRSESPLPPISSKIFHGEPLQWSTKGHLDEGGTNHFEKLNDGFPP